MFLMFLYFNQKSGKDIKSLRKFVWIVYSFWKFGIPYYSAPSCKFPPKLLLIYD